MGANAVVCVVFGVSLNTSDVRARFGSIEPSIRRILGHAPPTLMSKPVTALYEDEYRNGDFVANAHPSGFIVSIDMNGLRAPCIGDDNWIKLRSLLSLLLKTFPPGSGADIRCGTDYGASEIVTEEYIARHNVMFGVPSLPSFAASAQDFEAAWVKAGDAVSSYSTVPPELSLADRVALVKLAATADADVRKWALDTLERAHSSVSRRK